METADHPIASPDSRSLGIARRIKPRILSVQRKHLAHRRRVAPPRRPGFFGGGVPSSLRSIPIPE